MSKLSLKRSELTPRSAQAAPSALDAQRLQTENRQFAHTCGLSTCNADQDFIPAFRNDETGEVALARFADGRVAPMHLIINLPADWATARNARGQISAVLDSVSAGFVRQGQFYTRAEAAAAGQTSLKLAGGDR